MEAKPKKRPEPPVGKPIAPLKAPSLHSPEARAIATAECVRALEPLDIQARTRVLRAVAILLGIPVAEFEARS